MHILWSVLTRYVMIITEPTCTFSSKCRTQTQSVSFSLDHLLRGDELPGPLVWVHQRLLWNRLSPEPVQLLQGGERDVHGLWPAELHGPAVPPDQGRVPRVSEYHRIQWLHSVLPRCPSGKYVQNVTYQGETKAVSNVKGQSDEKYAWLLSYPE